MSQDVLEFNPAAGVKKAGRENKGERYLSKVEIRAYWHTTQELPPVNRAFFRLLLLIALRPGEVMKLQWSYFEDRVLSLPPEIVKNNTRHELYVTDSVLDELSRIRSLTSHTPYLFPGVSPNAPRKTFADAHHALLLLMNDGEQDSNEWRIPRFTPRDIRRTCETQMRRIIDDGEAVSRVLNHDVSTIRKHYDKNTYFDKKRNALIAWETWLQEVVT